jgi:hypothetical protein
MTGKSFGRNSMRFPSITKVNICATANFYGPLLLLLIDFEGARVYKNHCELVQLRPQRAGVCPGVHRWAVVCAGGRMAHKPPPTFASIIHGFSTSELASLEDAKSESFVRRFKGIQHWRRPLRI